MAQKRIALQIPERGRGKGRGGALDFLKFKVLLCSGEKIPLCLQPTQEISPS